MDTCGALRWRDRLAAFRARHGAVDVLATSAARKASSASEPSKPAAKKAPGPRLAHPEGSQGIQIGEPRLVKSARVIDRRTNNRLQLDALRAAGCAAIHEDFASGVSRSRPGLGRALVDTEAGDTLVVWRLDRLGRSLRDLLDISEMLRERDVALQSLTGHIDTATATGFVFVFLLSNLSGADDGSLTVHVFKRPPMDRHSESLSYTARYLLGDLVSIAVDDTIEWTDAHGGAYAPAHHAMALDSVVRNAVARTGPSAQT